MSSLARTGRKKEKENHTNSHGEPAWSDQLAAIVMTKQKRKKKKKKKRKRKREATARSGGVDNPVTLHRCSLVVRVSQAFGKHEPSQLHPEHTSPLDQ
ncbi:hypothetical protein IF1G_01475 [Cordyceps javanica]|uniref:Uncharacterized protein n=1 Tax=Cordyceps javanica TaxID=43265 RepID=A0A545VBY8_9HYPO|nr:hypothetical protein IF1G_01475 [Cordyceps javanica]